MEMENNMSENIPLVSAGQLTNLKKSLIKASVSGCSLKYFSLLILVVIYKKNTELANGSPEDRGTALISQY